MSDLFPLQMPSSADLETAAQELERLASQESPICSPRAALLFQAAATYRLVYEERQTREALRAMLQALTARGRAKSIFEEVFGDRGR